MIKNYRMSLSTMGLTAKSAASAYKEWSKTFHEQFMKECKYHG